MKLLFCFLFFILCSESYATQCRSPKQKRLFLYKQGYKTQPKNTVVDHICPLYCGGLDIPANMQLQTKEESLAKDKWETTKDGCAKLCNSSNSLPNRTVYNCKDN